MAEYLIVGDALAQRTTAGDRRLARVDRSTTVWIGEVDGSLLVLTKIRCLGDDTWDLVVHDPDTLEVRRRSYVEDGYRALHDDGRLLLELLRQVWPVSD